MRDIEMKGDQVLFECDVTLSHQIGTRDYTCIQYPMRPNYRPYGDHGEKLPSLKYDTHQADLRIEFNLDQNSANYDSSTMNNKVETHSLVSSEIQPQTNDCIGFFKNGTLVITPLTKVFAMRTLLQHVDQQSKARTIAKPEPAHSVRREEVPHTPSKPEEYQIIEGSYSDLISGQEITNLEGLVSQKQFIEMLCRGQEKAKQLAQPQQVSNIELAFQFCVLLPFSRIQQLLQKEGQSEEEAIGGLEFTIDYIHSHCKYNRQSGKLMQATHHSNSRQELGQLILSLFLENDLIPKQKVDYSQYQIYESVEEAQIQELEEVIKLLCYKTAEGLLGLKRLSEAQKAEEEGLIREKLGNAFLN